MAKAAGKKINTKKTLLIVGGAVATYLLYRLYESRKGGAAASGSASYVPAVMPGSGASTSTGSGSGSGAPAGSFATLADWEQAVLSSISGKLGAAQGLNAIGSWLNGNCVSAAAYSALGLAVEQHGLPPGFGYGVPTLSVCPSTGSSGSGTAAGSGSGSPVTSTPPASSGSSTSGTSSNGTPVVLGGSGSTSTTKHSTKFPVKHPTEGDVLTKLLHRRTTGGGRLTPG